MWQAVAAGACGWGLGVRDPLSTRWGHCLNGNDLAALQPRDGCGSNHGVVRMSNHAVEDELVGDHRIPEYHAMWGVPGSSRGDYCHRDYALGQGDFKPAGPVVFADSEAMFASTFSIETAES